MACITKTISYDLPDELWHIVKDYMGLISKSRLTLGGQIHAPVQFKLFKHITTTDPLIKLHRLKCTGLKKKNRPKISFECIDDGWGPAAVEMKMLFGKKQTSLEEYQVNLYKWALMGGERVRGERTWWNHKMNIDKWRLLESIIKRDVSAHILLEEGSIFRFTNRMLPEEAKLKSYLDEYWEGESYKRMQWIVVKKTKLTIKFIAYKNSMGVFLLAGGMNYHTKKPSYKYTHTFTFNKRQFREQSCWVNILRV